MDKLSLGLLFLVAGAYAQGFAPAPAAAPGSFYHDTSYPAPAPNFGWAPAPAPGQGWAPAPAPNMGWAPAPAPAYGMGSGSGSGSGYGMGSGSGYGIPNAQGFWPDLDPGSPMHGWDGRTCAALRLAYKSSECCYATLTKQTKYSFVHTHYSDFAKCGDLKTAYKESTCCGHQNFPLPGPRVVLPQFYFIDRTDPKHTHGSQVHHHNLVGGYIPSSHTTSSGSGSGYGHGSSYSGAPTSYSDHQAQHDPGMPGCMRATIQGVPAPFAGYFKADDLPATVPPMQVQAGQLSPGPGTLCDHNHWSSP